MSNQRPSFAKRDREMKLKDKARAKIERRSAKRSGKIAPHDLPEGAEAESAADVPAAASPAAPPAASLAAPAAASLAAPAAASPAAPAAASPAAPAAASPAAPLVPLAPSGE